MDVNINLFVTKNVLLTEEWLKKLGFENNTGKEWMIECGESCFIIEYFEYTKAWHYTGGEGTRNGKGCKYVHELQNLVYAMEGEELALKEIP